MGRVQNRLLLQVTPFDCRFCDPLSTLLKPHPVESTMTSGVRGSVCCKPIPGIDRSPYDRPRNLMMSMKFPRSTGRSLGVVQRLRGIHHPNVAILELRFSAILRYGIKRHWRQEGKEPIRDAGPTFHFLNEKAYELQK